MKIVLLSGASSIHTIRWANGLSGAGNDVHVISQQPQVERFGAGVKVHSFPQRGVLGYFTMVLAVRRLLREINPDIVNAHYASGYGTTARLVGFRPWVLSVWGSDIYDFPYKSPMHKWLVRKNCLAADQVASTSHCMAEQTRRVVPGLGKISITPFGVDMEAFKGIRPVGGDSHGLPIVIGTVKSMAPKYGVDTLIKAFSIVHQRLTQEQDTVADHLRLRLVGDGPQSDELKGLARQVGVGEITTFTGRVPYRDVPQELTKLDIYVALSRLESFGVAIIEAGAAGRPVVVSDAGGLPEVVIDGGTGIVVPRDDPDAAADAIVRLVRDPELRHRMGATAQEHVERQYSWQACLETMQQVYLDTIEQAGGR